jgi:YaiO family outer membrane protein
MTADARAGGSRRRAARICRVALPALGLLFAVAGACAGQTLDPDRTTGNAEDHPAGARFFLTPLYGASHLTGGRPSWQELDVELLYRPRNDLIVGADVDVRDRPPARDERYSALAIWSVTRMLELRGRVTVAPAPAFSAEREYTAGAEWRAFTQASVMFDYRRLEFPTGPVDEYKPAVTIWFSDETSLNLRYTRGRAFGQSDYDGGAVRLVLGLPASHRLTLGYSHDADPEIDPGVPGVLFTKADTWSAYYRLPLSPRLDLVAGAEYEDRLHLYRRTTGTVGFTTRF